MKSRLTMFTILVAAALLISLVATGCPPGEEVVDEEKILKVGVQGPFTGPAARTGDEFKAAVGMAFEKINYTIGDYTVELIWIDCQSDPEIATRAYEEAIVRDEIDVGFLNWHSSVAVALMEVAARNKVPHFFGFGATEVVNEKFASEPEFYSYWMFKAWPTPAKLSRAYVESLEEAIEKGIWQPRNKRVAIYGEDTDWGRSFGAAIAADFENAGWEVVGEQFFSLGETELVPLLTRLRDMDVAVVAGTVTSAPSFAAFIKQAREVDLQSVIIADGLGWIGEWYDLTGEASNYVLDQIPAWTTDAAKQFAQDFEAKHGFTPSTSGAGLAYDQASFFIAMAQEVLNKYGELNRETFHQFGQEYLRTGEFTFTDGIIMEEYKFTPETVPDMVVGKGYFIFPVIQYYEGEGSIIWPDAWKEADFVVPAYLQ